MRIFKLISDNLERWMMMVLFVALFFIVMAGIISRVVFHDPFTWTEEAARLVFIWLIFMGISYGTKYDKHINVTVMLDKMPAKAAAVCTIFWDFVALAVFVWVAFYGVQYISYMRGSYTPVLRIDQGITTSIIAVSAILNVIRIIEKMVKEHIPHLKEV